MEEKIKTVYANYLALSPHQLPSWHLLPEAEKDAWREAVTSVLQEDAPVCIACGEWIERPE